MDEQQRQKKVLRILTKLYPQAECALQHDEPFQLLVATILSAQCTDERVNQVTPPLFAKYPDAKSFAQAKAHELEAYIKSTGFFRSKAQAILQSAQAIESEHGGEVPDTMEALLKLRGVGRKTANVVLGNGFGKALGIVVDTHVKRLSRRLGFSQAQDPVLIERELMEWVPKKYWTIFSHWLILHGRAVCKAIKPRCGQCKLSTLCPASQIKR